jgi:hypothetical protein
MKVNMRYLLHTDQEYEYLSPLAIGDKLAIETKLTDVKQRRALKFVTLVSRITAAGKPRLVSTTTFVVRTPEGGA